MRLEGILTSPHHAQIKELATPITLYLCQKDPTMDKIFLQSLLTFGILLRKTPLVLLNPSQIVLPCQEQDANLHSS